jgi:hypothetical protein
MVSHQEAIETGLCDLNRRLKEEKIGTMLGTIKAVLSSELLKKLPEVGTRSLLAGLAGHALASVPGGLIAAAGISALELLSFMIEKKSSEREIVLKCPFSYLHQAQTEGILGSQ